MYDCTYEAYEYLKVSSKGLVGWLLAVEARFIQMITHEL